MPRDHIEYSQPVGDQVAYTTCYMCACRCGIKVHLRGGTLRYIEGNRDHPVNRGVLCAKGSAGIMNVLSPARLRAPLKRIGPRGSGEFAEISWDEALAIATDRLRRIRETDPISSPTSPAGISRSLSPAFLRKLSALSTSPPMAGSAR